MSPLDDGAAKASARDPAVSWTGLPTSAAIGGDLSLASFPKPSECRLDQSHIAPLFNVAVEFLERNYAEFRGPNAPETFAQVDANRQPGAAEVAKIAKRRKK